jgi:hypothetical protein
MSTAGRAAKRLKGQKIEKLQTDKVPWENIILKS